MTKRNSGKQERKTGVFATERKVSEMIWQFAGEFIRLGKTLGEKQNRLNVACTAWNMACIRPEVRNRSLNQYMESYQSYNTDVSDEQISGVRSDMEILIQNKLSLFPTVQEQIVDAKVIQVAGKDRINAISTELPSKGMQKARKVA